MLTFVADVLKNVNCLNEKINGNHLFSIENYEQRDENVAKLVTQYF